MGSVHLNRLPRGRCKARATRRACVVVAATVLAPLPAAAQQAQGYALTAAEITDGLTMRNDGDMDFGGIIPTGSGGTIVMTPSVAATCTITGTLVRSGLCKAAAFAGIAFTGADVRVNRPSGDRIDLTGPGAATMRLRDFTFGSTGTTVMQGGNGPNPRFRVDALDSVYLFFVGGTLNVAGNQAPGIYNGTFEIRINFN